MSIELPEEVRHIRAVVRRFVREQLLPHESALEEHDDLPMATWQQLEAKSIELGLNALALPEPCGGGGLSMLGQVVAAEEMGRVAVGFRHLVGTPLGAEALARFGTPFQIEQYLRPWVQGKRRAAWAATEPNAGSDLAGMRTAARRDGDRWIISGSKHFITGLDKSDFILTFAVTEKGKGLRGLTAFLIDQHLPGVHVGRHERMMGRAGLHSYELFFDDVAVPDDCRLGPVNEGFKVLIGNVSQMRLLMGGHCVGVAARLLEMASEYGRRRHQFGRPIGELEALQWYLADSAVEMQAARLMTYHAAWKIDRGQDVRYETAIVKAFATEMAGRVADRVLQFHGGAGYSKELPIEAAYRAVRLLRIAEGSSEIQRVLIARSLLSGTEPSFFA